MSSDSGSDPIESAKRVDEQESRHETLGRLVSEATFDDFNLQSETAYLKMGDHVLEEIGVELVLQQAVQFAYDGTNNE